MARLLVAGPPCGGKTTYAREHLLERERLLDFDLLAEELGFDGFVADEAVREMIFGVFRDRIPDSDVIVATSPRRRTRDRYREEGAHVVVVIASREECLLRAVETRPLEWQGAIEEWFAEYEPSDEDEVVRTDG